MKELDLNLKFFSKVEYIQNGKKITEKFDNRPAILTVDEPSIIKITTYEEKSVIKFVIKNSIFGFINFIASTGDFLKKNEIKKYNIMIDNKSNDIIDDVFLSKQKSKSYGFVLNVISFVLVILLILFVVFLATNLHIFELNKWKEY